MQGAPSVALVWRGDPADDVRMSRYWERLKPVVVGLRDAGLDPRPLLYDEGHVDSLRDVLEGCRGVLVWVDPLTNGSDRTQLDALLEDLESSDRWVSARPRTIAAIGTKRVLVATQDMGWGVDASEYHDLAELRAGLEGAMRRGEPRVLKPARGNGGQGVVRIVPSPDGDLVVVQLAARRDEVFEPMSIGDVVARFASTFDRRGTVVDQRFVATARSGMVRAYVSVDRVVGFCTQVASVEAERGALHLDPAFAMASPKTMYDATEAGFAALRGALESEWLPELRRRYELADEDLPAVWDLDFLHSESGEGFALCEINVSCVTPFPASAVPAIVDCAVSRCH